MFFKQLDLTTALRPSLLPDETLLFVQDAVGLYEGYDDTFMKDCSKLAIPPNSRQQDLVNGEEDSKLISLESRKYKIPSYQKGHAYLTSHRVCYVDDDESRKHSVAIDLRDVDRFEYQAGFLRSSPKITLHPKPKKHTAGQIRGSWNSPTTQQSVNSFSSGQPESPLSRSNSPFHPSKAPTPVRSSNATWICPICSFSNPVPSSFEPATANSSAPLPPCLACGIKPPFATVLKAAIAAASNRSGTPANSGSIQSTTESTRPEQIRVNGSGTPVNTSPSPSVPPESTIACPRCTFLNHPSLLACELCSAPLLSSEALRSPLSDIEAPSRPESPGPLLSGVGLSDEDSSEAVKLSFRAGGEKIFHERLKGAMIQRKWLLQGAPPVPKPPQSPTVLSDLLTPGPQASSRPGAVGIAGLERRGLETRKNNEFVIGNAFEDLEALMASAKEIVALAETFATESGRATNGSSTEANAVLSQSAAALGMVTTKDMLGSGGGSELLYLSELSRSLAEHLTDDRKGILRSEGGIMSLIDVWAVFNRSRNGVELISPTDFQKAAQLWEKLKLPVRLRRFKSGLLVVQRYDWTDEKTISQFKAWLRELHDLPPLERVAWDWRTFGRGVTAQEAAQRFGWSVGVAAEELEMAEDKGLLCREEGIEGLGFWSNHIIDEELANSHPTDHGINNSMSQLTI